MGKLQVRFKTPLLLGIGLAIGYLTITVGANAASTSTASTPSLAKQAAPATDTFSLIIFLSADADKQQLLDSVSHYGAKVIYDYQNMNALAVQVSGKPENEAILYFQRQKGVLQVNRNGVQSVQNQ